VNETKGRDGRTASRVEASSGRYASGRARLHDGEVAPGPPSRGIRGDLRRVLCEHRPARPGAHRAPYNPPGGAVRSNSAPRAVRGGGHAGPKGTRSGAARSGTGRAGEPIGPIAGMKGVVVERDGRRTSRRGQGGRPDATPGLDPGHGHRRGHRRGGVAGASESGAGSAGRSSEWGPRPPIPRPFTDGDQGIEAGRPGPHGIRPRRDDVVRAPGGRGGPRQPSSAREHEPGDQARLRAAASGARRHADDFRGSRREHGSRSVGSIVDRIPVTGLSTA
jgi:hypothetical protein